jgi:hypothetical protein
MLGHMLRRVAAAVLATIVTAAALSGCNDNEQPDKPVPSAVSTPLTDFATDGVTIARADFCARVAPDAVEEALGGAAESSETYANGDRAQVAPGVHDVVHEYGCTWKAADGTIARAWVFAPPVTAEQAAALRKAATGRGCRPIKDAPAYGDPSVAVRCGAETAFHGLFGDAWLSCSVEATEGEPGALLDRTGRWCVTVAQAATA